MLRVIFFLSFAAVAIAADEEADRLPDGAGKAAVVKVCLTCHGAANFRKLRLNRDGWSDQVADMVDRGAQGTEPEITSVLDYLVENFGPDSKLRVNTAGMQELKNVLKISSQDARALVKFRDEHGPFNTSADLLKVPGVDAKKIEEKKDVLVF